jgi:uncharacterized membrane protein YfcA
MTHVILIMACGLVVGLSLGLIGGGGSVLAVPLLMYVVRVPDPHIAIGTSAFAVGVNALVNLLGHWRRGHVKWPCAATFAIAGVTGAVAGSQLGKSFDDQKLLFLFAFVMAAVGLAMLGRRASAGDPAVRIDPAIATRLLGIGLVAGFISGFFGIGGGFLIVPGIMFASGMPVINAIGSSLIAVSLLGFTTAASYALSGLIDWSLALQLVAGGVVGGAIGIGISARLGARRRELEKIFAGVVLLLAASVAIRAGLALRG